MELSDREYRVVGMALLIYANSPVDRLRARDHRETEHADREIARSLYYKFLASSAGVPTTGVRS